MCYITLEGIYSRLIPRPRPASCHLQFMCGESLRMRLAVFVRRETLRVRLAVRVRRETLRVGLAVRVRRESLTVGLAVRVRRESLGMRLDIKKKRKGNKKTKKQGEPILVGFLTTK